jgi:hypothetical protein
MKSPHNCPRVKRGYDIRTTEEVQTVQAILYLCNNTEGNSWLHFYSNNCYANSPVLHYTYIQLLITWLLSSYTQLTVFYYLQIFTTTCFDHLQVVSSNFGYSQPCFAVTYSYYSVYVLIVKSYKMFKTLQLITLIQYLLLYYIYVYWQSYLVASWPRSAVKGFNELVMLHDHAYSSLDAFL